MTLREEVQALLDYCSYVACYAPNFPEEDGTDLESSFSELLSGLDGIRVRTHRPEARQWLEVARREFGEALLHYRAGDTDRGETILRRAQEHVEAARSRRTTQPTFLIGPSGEIEPYSLD